MLSRPDFELGAQRDGAPVGSRAITVSELNRSVRGMLERGFPLVAIRGEVSNFTRAASGHLYFVLKDAGAQVRCAMWRARAQALGFTPANGDAVELRATVTLFEGRGEFQLNVESMRRDGAGNLFEAFQRLKEKLAAEGLFEQSRKRALPAFPRSIGIVTSLKAAALRDVLTALRRRAPMVAVVVYPAPVQGEGAAAAIARAIEAANEHGAAEVLIVGRGGGGIEDLWAFNEEVVARAIAASKVPVISGVGHETDFTIADFVADLRAPTPTAAAELVSPHRDDLLGRVADAADALGRAMETRLAGLRQRLDWVARELLPPSARLEARRRHLAELARGLDWQMARVRERRRAALAALSGRLRAPSLSPWSARLAESRAALLRAMGQAQRLRHEQLARLTPALAHLDPAHVLARGYSVVRAADGKIVRGGKGLAVGEMLDVTFSEGGATVKVDKPRP